MKNKESYEELLSSFADFAAQTEREQKDDLLFKLYEEYPCGTRVNLLLPGGVKEDLSGTVLCVTRDAEICVALDNGRYALCGADMLVKLGIRRCASCGNDFSGEAYASRHFPGKSICMVCANREAPFVGGLKGLIKVD